MSYIDSLLTSSEMEANRLRAEVEELRADLKLAQDSIREHRAEVERLRSQFADSEREAARLRAALELIAAPWRPGIANLSREDCQEIAADTLRPVPSPGTQHE